jgi:hypothetical protein
MHDLKTFFNLIVLLLRLVDYLKTLWYDLNPNNDSIVERIESIKVEKSLKKQFNCFVVLFDFPLFSQNETSKKQNKLSGNHL